jgi:aryl-alcohol dehydrogenase-like predicted oxidoreductase
VRVVDLFLQYNIPRENLIIATKVFSIVYEDTGIQAFRVPGIGDSRDYVNQHGLSRGAIFNAVEACLKRLNTTYIDLLQIHRFDRKTPPEETMKALHDLVTSGKVRYLGASSMWTWQLQMLNHIADKNGWTKFVSMQNNYSLLYREEV